MKKTKHKDAGEERYERLIKFLTDYIYTVKVENGKAVETYHGPGCFAVTGYTSEDYEADTELWYRMVYEEDKPAVLEQARKALAGINVKPLEHRIIHRNGSIRWVKNSIVHSKDEKGNLLYYDGLISDITELKEAEEENTLKQKQLIQADKMVALGTMVSGIAHEINNPNNFILLNAQFLQQVSRDIQPILTEYFNTHGDFVVSGMPYSNARDKITQSLNSIVDGTLRIQKITRSLTNFARADSGEMNYDIKVKSVVENAVLIAGNIIKNSTNHFSFTYQKNIPTVKGNPQQLEQVLINLINNACQSLTDKDQKVCVNIDYRPETEKIIIEVKDGGSGINEENLKYIFDPFFTTKRNSGGTGLGLYISYNIIKSHGGDLMLKSEKGKGTLCTIILPANKNSEV
ncbi:MAG: ATP-binding protein [Bacteroidota bacterium]